MGNLRGKVVEIYRTPTMIGVLVNGTAYDPATLIGALAIELHALRSAPANARAVAEKCAWLCGELDGGEPDRDEAIRECMATIRAYAATLPDAPQPATQRSKAAHHAAHGLTAAMIDAHYPISQHQPDECEMCHALHEIAKEAIEASLSETAPSGTAKVEGWKLVRDFPTAEQQIAGVKAAGGTLAEGFIVGIYRAMLAVAPLPKESA